MLLDGAEVASDRRRALAGDSDEPLVLGVIVATDDPATHSYVERKCRAAEEIGWRVRIMRLPKDVSQERVIRACEEMNRDPRVTGYIVQLPLPAAIDEHAVLSSIDPAKDA